MKTATDKLIHLINETYYLEYTDGRVEKIALASRSSTEELLQKMIEKDPNVLTGS